METKAQKAALAWIEQLNKNLKDATITDSVLLEFKKEAAEKIYSEAMQRQEYQWAASFVKKYGL